MSYMKPSKLAILIVLFALIIPLSVFGENAEARELNHHQLRIGWGDQHFEYVAWHASPQPVNTLPVTYSAVYAEHFRYTQHWFAEYQYRLNSWFSCGGMVDGSGVLWDNVTRNGLGEEHKREANQSLYNLIAMPTIYFTYLHHEYVSLYSGLGFGLDINGGTETDLNGRTVVCAPAFNLTLLGLSVNYQRWFATVDIGGLMALNGGQKIYLFGSKIFSASIGFTF